MFNDLKILSSFESTKMEILRVEPKWIIPAGYCRSLAKCIKHFHVKEKIRVQSILIDIFHLLAI